MQNYFGIRQSGDRNYGIAHDCCTQRCTYQYLKTYCARDDKISSDTIANSAECMKFYNKI
jgi:hypothetical protein